MEADRLAKNFRDGRSVPRVAKDEMEGLIDMEEQAVIKEEREEEKQQQQTRTRKKKNI